MAELELTVPARGLKSLSALVSHVLSEHPQNESDWLEWKSGLDLTRADGLFALAKNILGFSNRMPARARVHMGGLAYVVVGAEPGTLYGLVAIDPAKLHDHLQSYIGLDGPAWAPTWVAIESTTVLVVTVEAPTEGDPIHCLRRDFDRFRDGSVFVRRPGMTAPATSEEMRQLVDRAGQSRTFGVDIAVKSTGNPVARPFLDEADTETFINQERDRLMSPLNNEKDLVARARRVVREARRAALYQQQVDQYLQECRARFLVAAFLTQMRRGTAVVNFEIQNQSDRNLLSLEVRIRFPSYSKAFGTIPDEPLLPEPPQLWGEAFIFQDEANRLRRAFSGVSLFIPQPIVRTLETPQQPVADVTSRRIDERDPSVLVLWTQNLRPHGRADFMRIPFAVASNAPSPLIVDWTATATDANGIAEGQVEIALDEPQLAGNIIRNP